MKRSAANEAEDEARGEHARQDNQIVNDLSLWKMREQPDEDASSIDNPTRDLQKPKLFERRFQNAMKNQFSSPCLSDGQKIQSCEKFTLFRVIREGLSSQNSGNLSQYPVG